MTPVFTNSTVQWAAYCGENSLIHRTLKSLNWL